MEAQFNINELNAGILNTTPFEHAYYLVEKSKLKAFDFDELAFIREAVGFCLEYEESLLGEGVLIPSPQGLADYTKIYICSRIEEGVSLTSEECNLISDMLENSMYLQSDDYLPAALETADFMINNGIFNLRTVTLVESMKALHAYRLKPNQRYYPASYAGGVGYKRFQKMNSLAKKMQTLTTSVQ